jgi:hypothetical protein
MTSWWAGLPVPQRPVSAVPKLIVAILALALALQAGLRFSQPPLQPYASDLPPPPPLTLLRMVSLGEPKALAKLMMVYLQAYDYRADNKVPFQKLDYGFVAQWLGEMLALDPAAQYPLFAASRIYADVPDQAKTRIMLEFIYREFPGDPDRRWPWLATAALLAKHRLHDLPLALRYASAIALLANAPDVPDWARTMNILLLEDMSELDQVKVLLGGLLVSGQIRDPAEARFLKQKLDDLEQSSARKPGATAPR